jgi:hypothetical protein
MENFFKEEEFCHDLDDVIRICDLEDDGAISELEEDWSIEVEESELQKIFTLKKEFVVNAIIEQTDTWEERFPEDSDRLFEEIKKAVEQSIDIEKMNSLLPELYYPNGKKFTITKKELLEYIA